jgi:hypothetical protein
MRKAKSGIKLSYVKKTTVKTPPINKESSGDKEFDLNIDKLLFPKTKK